MEIHIKVFNSYTVKIMNQEANMARGHREAEMTIRMEGDMKTSRRASKNCVQRCEATEKQK
jgi:hypothetical protein